MISFQIILITIPLCQSNASDAGQALTEFYSKVIIVETVATMNAAFCDFHLRNCPPSQQLLDECQKVIHVWALECTKFITLS